VVDGIQSREVVASTARVLDAVRIGGCATRTEVSASTGLAKALVGERLRTLIEWGLVREGGVLSSSGGRPAQRLSIAAERGHVLALEIGMRHLTGCIADLNGRVQRARSMDADIKAGPSEVCGAAVELLCELERTADPERHGRLIGLGVGVAAPVEFATGKTVHPPVSPNWHSFPVRDMFSSAFGVPAWADNEVNLMALAESRVGAAVGHQNTLTFKLGSWIGAGLVSNGRLHRGAQGCAGSLASRAGGEALERAALELAQTGSSVGLKEALSQYGSLTVQTITKVAEAGDGEAARLLDEAAIDVGRVMSVLVDFFNPSLLVIAGSLTHGGDAFLSRVRETIYGSAISLAARDLQIVQSSLDDESAATGAAMMALDGIFAPEALAATLGRLGAETSSAS
jgi:predicted NBD/HSP70 family sugar kinase